MPLQATSGAASQDAFGGNGVAVVPTYIEDIFSCFLYTGNGSTQTITNGIDLAGEGGLVWLKARNTAIENVLTGPNFTIQGGSNVYGSLRSDSTNASGFNSDISSFNSDGFTLKNYQGTTNGSGNTHVSWTFRKQPKFFDVVTYTGNGGTLAVSHALTSTPGCVFVKRTNGSSDWVVGHRGSSGSYWASETLRLNTTAAGVTNGEFAAMSDTTVTVVNSGAGYGDVNTNGATYVMYLFAHNAGGFGLTGTDNVISCGSYNRTDGVKSVVNLGFEPQFIIQKTATAGSQWTMLDVMRGWTGASNSNLFANLSNAETTGNIGIMPTATGFEDYTTAGATDTIIYIAIRRGPMKVPTSGTSVFEPIAYTGTGANNRQIGASTFVVDYILGTKRNTVDGKYFYTRLQGNGAYLSSTNTNAEAGAGSTLYGPQYGKIQLGYQQGSNDSLNLDNSGDTFINYLFRRAPGFFDEVCYTGTGVANLQTHNLGVTPELLIIRSRSQSGTYGGYWLVLSASGSNYRSLFLNTTDSNQGNFAISSISTSTTVNIGYIGSNILTAANTSAATFVAYLFATVAGVSKVGSYTGTGTTQTINCGFTSGARFVLIKRTDSTGDWYVWDSARGIVAGNDPHISLNTTAAEVTTDDSVDTDSTGFVVNQVAATNINVASASYIFLAVS